MADVGRARTRALPQGADQGPCRGRPRPLPPWPGDRARARRRTSRSSARPGDGAEAVDKAADLLPDIVLMDVRMPKRGGIEACTSIKEVAPSAKIIMLTISDEEADLYEAIKAGATGYLLKEISTDEVATAIRAVADGQSQISPSMASKLLTEFKSMIQRTDERRLVPAPRLTDRELEVLKLVATGMNNRDIAKELFISENTVKNHVRNILEKLQLHSRMEAVVYAMREKILEIR